MAEGEAGRPVDSSHVLTRLPNAMIVYVLKWI